MLSHMNGKQLVLQPEVSHSGNSHHMKNEREKPVNESIEIKCNICSLSENSSVKRTHAGLDVFFFSDSAGTLQEAKQSRDICLSRRHYSKSTLAKYIFQMLFIQAELMKHACTFVAATRSVRLQVSAGGQRSSWG